ncbi:glycoside hydrolase family 92 protein [Sphingobacterium sp. DK4209]|uniref:Glycoside hydrolase family 92 protein n=1 Tax=Sphingobacterium zhuxiongii TaxID=2662364 RepID=A0A5Q0Q9R0_9SPHI|nr:MULTISPECIES: GH92 family glycosyl hydrolase [unclassified Sphingobacterium]MVZ67092.1 glycoside hydrolase family 92 protein [Sphingobacterium sp. DK4209]QGA26837.1 glycoside hydrolase family 92 protein [Sphingobacterium sp. dk4302]
MNKNYTRIGKFLLLAVLPSLGFAQQKKLTDYVNPLIGTAKMGHTFPGATVPFGAVQLSPDTDTIPYAFNGKYTGTVYEYCAGYQYKDKTIVGFSHTHFSGTGHSDLGDILVMPTQGKVQLNPGTADRPQDGYRSPFSHDNEVAEPNYYKVKLDKHNILAELTTSTRVGMHRYTFPKSEDSHIILDLTSGIYNYDEKNVWTVVRVLNDSTITGYRQTNGWARTRTVYFAIKTSKPFKNYGAKYYDKETPYKGFWRKFNQRDNFPDLASHNVKLHLDFDTESSEQVMMKVALSPVSMRNALANMDVEVPNWDFDQVVAQGKDAWEKELGKIKVDMLNESDLVNFYTSIYHANLMPTEYMDTNGEYKGLDQEIHKADGFVNYTSFSLWDTFRAFHPWLNLINPSRNSDIVSSMMAHYDQSLLGMLPIWSHYANDNWCMSGYHSVSVVADAILKGVYKGDAEAALKACISTANARRYEGIGEYIDLGYVPDEVSTSSVSNTLEYAYDDWCIAQIAKKLGHIDIAAEFDKRANYWRNVYDEQIGFMRPKDKSGKFRAEFDVLDTHGQGFIEGNSWNYSLYVPHDPNGLKDVMGGEKRFEGYLDSLFSMHLPDKYFEKTEDITREGIIGNYVHGNEPSHHVAYLYNITKSPWKTQEKVRQIIRHQYNNGADGLGGNDDCGQMSAWYLFTSLGFYPVAPGDAHYWIGSPLVKSASIALENGKELKIFAKNQGEKNVYVSNVSWNGQEIKDFKITHEQLMSGGELQFVMSSKPKKK